MKSNKKIIFIVIQIIFIVLLILSIYNIYKWYTDNKKTKTIVNDITKSVTIDENNKTRIDFTSLKEKNSDVIAYLKVNGTDIYYPVVKSNNNEYYLNHSFDKTISGAGWIFTDYRNKNDGSDKNLIIYGHNRRDGSMFGTLKNILNKEWYENKENKYITLNKEDKDVMYEVFSVYQIEEEDYYIKTEFRDDEFYSFINKLKQRSINDFNTEITEKDSILTLSTCANDNHYRVILHAKKIN